MGPLLRLLHAAAVTAMLAAVVMGYGAMTGRLPVATHIPWGFGLALGIAFTHAMTVFYFAGIGVSLREAAGGRRWAVPLLARASALRRGLAWPIGLAIVSLMAAVILGGGSHTRWLPSWVHHALSLIALPLNLLASIRSRRAIAEQEGIALEASRRLDGGPAPLDRRGAAG